MVVVVLGIVLWIVISRLRVENRQRHLSEYITNNMPSGMLTVDARGLITSHNPSSQRIFGYDLGTGRQLADLVEETEELASLLDRCVRTGAAFTRREFNVSDPAGPLRHIGVNFSPITTPTGQVDGVLCLLSDLTEIVKLQDQIRLKDNFASLGEMSAGIAHEFKNSLATISGYSQMLGAESDPSKMQKYAGEIDKETRNLSRIVREFLNFARPVETSMHPTQISALVTAAVQDLKSARAGKYTVKVNAGYVPPILCDTTLLQQAIFNLLINAADASSDEGTIEVSVELDEALNQVQLHVIDTGCGISHHDLQKIFIPFFTTKAAGTGLGLPLVQKIVLAHSGTIMIDSREREGTRVSISLPVHSLTD
jgi:PAS domain S-box-containing protein